MRSNHNPMNHIAGTILTWAAIVVSAGVIGLMFYILAVLMMAAI